MFILEQVPENSYNREVKSLMLDINREHPNWKLYLPSNPSLCDHISERINVDLKRTFDYRLYGKCPSTVTLATNDGKLSDIVQWRLYKLCNLFIRTGV